MAVKTTYVFRSGRDLRYPVRVKICVLVLTAIDLRYFVYIICQYVIFYQNDNTAIYRTRWAFRYFQNNTKKNGKHSELVANLLDSESNV